MIGVIGAGAFGTALAAVQAQAGRDVVLWGRDGAVLETARGDGVSPKLPGVTLPEGLRFSDDLADLAGAEVLLLVVPAQQTRVFLAEHGLALPDVPLVLCAKGIDAESLRLQSDVAEEVLPGRVLAVLTGPGFAGEIARGLPTALTLACGEHGLGPALQHDLSTPRMRLYLTDDVVGAQIGGALKNVVAIACGMVEGAGLGASAQAALMTRGFAEMTRLAVAMGAEATTLAGLSGLGDLSLTCNSRQSRNFSAGYAIGAGEVVGDGTVEGVATARAARDLAGRFGVEMPIAAAVADVLGGAMTMEAAMDGLLARPLKEE
ncbi:NAD(P)H-dependent glycerol-3-phosphate dehydrogenase [Amaricoccus tamworthensis]|uniref:NAD(P)H-dependent glycerol-3-phosphate dehydrogenase n=1 Tax=Amaricoccus tamworthensis TaxID=57002 RepID=UPI003C79FF7F